jgi:hypothetical protein
MPNLRSFLSRGSVASWDDNYIDNITFLRTYRLLVNKFAMGKEGGHFEPQIESMDIPIALWCVFISSMTSLLYQDNLAGCYAMILTYMPIQLAFYLFLSGSKLRHGQSDLMYTQFLPIFALSMGVPIVYIMAASGHTGISFSDIIMGIFLILVASYASWVSTATGMVSINYASSVRRVLFAPL